MNDPVQLGVNEIASAYLDLAAQLAQVGQLLRRDDCGPAAPYHIFLVGGQFVVLKQFASRTQTPEQTGAICITLGQDDALGMALGRGNARTLTSRCMVRPVRCDENQWMWQSTFLTNTPASSKEIAAEIHRRLAPRTQESSSCGLAVIHEASTAD